MQTSTSTRVVRTLHRYSVQLSSKLRVGQTRTFSASCLLRDENASGEENAFKRGKQTKVDPQAVESWFRGEGLPYLNPIPGKSNWLGGDIPYIDNPTFKPPPPLSDVVKSSIYDRYLKALQPAASKSDSHAQTLRTLSEQFGISIARVEAIIRLKEYERQYQKVCCVTSEPTHDEYNSISLEDLQYGYTFYNSPELFYLASGIINVLLTRTLVLGNTYFRYRII
ncbi:hypothetical protein RSAG8_06952, partial [Rhizoctonia solani AG-8 WAC10335]